MKVGKVKFQYVVIFLSFPSPLHLAVNTCFNKLPRKSRNIFANCLLITIYVIERSFLVLTQM